MTNNEENKDKIGVSGKIAQMFIQSKLTPLIILASIILGVFATVVTPREEEPQIVVPMADVFVQYPGATAQEVEARVTRPMEQLISEIPGVEYVYSIIKPGMNLTIVRYQVGQNAEDSTIKLYNKLYSNFDRIPQGVSQPLIKIRSIDDVPILALTMSSNNKHFTGYELRRVAAEIADELKKDGDVSEVSVTGGQKRQVKVTFDPAKLQGYNLSTFQIMQAIQKSNFLLNSGRVQSDNKEFIVDTGGFIKDSTELGNLVVGVNNNMPVYLKNVAEVEDTAEEPVNYVFNYDHKTGSNEAVTISLSKKKGTNATNVSHRALAKIENMKSYLIPNDINITVTRNYGETAKEKSDELLSHMLIATISVIALIAFFLGRKEALVVAVAVPVTLSLTLLISFLMGYTLNRVTLFALIFSIGILVDDAIVVVENIHRHFKLEGASIKTAVKAVNEVGNPTILATFTVVAALLPMAFVSGLMGPYMRPIPIGASAAMIFSLLVAFIVSPWLSYIVLKDEKHEGEDHEEHQDGKMVEIYKHILTPLVENRGKRLNSMKIIAGLLILAFMLVPLKLVQFKMLPFDNKSEIQIIVDMPEGSTLEETAAVTQALGKYINTIPEVINYQTYVGSSAPHNFNGLVRHYFLRSNSNEADIQVNLKPKHDRHKQSHDLAKMMRPELQKIGVKYNANVKLAEIPPGPPVISTLVAEVYGPDPEKQVEIAGKIKDIFTKVKGIVDVDWYVEDPQTKITFIPDKEKAALNGVSTDIISQAIKTSLGGTSAGLVHFDKEKEPVEIFLRMPLSERSDINALTSITVPAQTGRLIPVSGLVKQETGEQEQTIYHKNMRRVTYVTGDVAKEIESPVYAVLDMNNIISKLKLDNDKKLKQLNIAMPDNESEYSVKWDGEWHITLEVFRDMGIAFAAVLVLIYVLVVAWFKDFVTPLVIMAPIPLTLVGILPGHLIFQAFFTATSMIGFIALSGIIVRNSILLVDFIHLETQEGTALKEAVIKAGLVRFRPILLTALAVVVGSFVMLFDPIFQGLAIAMMFGAVVATILTLIVVPVLYYEIFSKKEN
ncbi:MAG: efflux RND transporter permease subunit [Candidatus Gastranaerophilales bacterium]|nr:efflux RND transporter permease subunit [Candidatus Gastranaerophilales bacterium]